MMNDIATISAPVRGDVEPVNPAPHDPILSAILIAARDPQVDIEKLGALKAMYEEERAYRAQQEFNEARAAAQAEMAPVVRDKANDQTRSKYATIEAIANAITPIYTKHGFGMSFGECKAEKPDHLGIEGELTRGSVTKHYQTEVPIDRAGIAGKVNKTDTHAYGSTMTYGRRYLKLLIWDIATKDDDGNAAGKVHLSGEVASTNDVMEMREALKWLGRSEEKFLEYANKRLSMPVDSLDKLPVEHVAKVREMIDSALATEKARRAKEAMNG